MLLGPFKKKRKASCRAKKLQKTFLKITKEEEHLWSAYCEYGHVRITSGDKFIRFTVAKPNNKGVHHLTCKYDKYNNFRVYYSCNQGVRDITYRFPYSNGEDIAALMKCITNIYENKMEVVYKEFRTRFISIFGDEITFEEKVIALKRNSPDIRKLIWRKIYPLTKHPDKRKQVSVRLPNFIARAARAYDPKEFTKRLFGKAPKSLIKAVILHMPLTDGSVNALFLARVFYHIWPIDKVVEFLRITALDGDCGIYMFGYGSSGRYNHVPTDSTLNINLWRSVLKHYSPNKVLNWLHKYGEEFGTFTFDTVKQIAELKERGIKVGRFKKMDIKGIHDVVSRYYLRLKKKELPLPVWDNMHNLNGKDCKGYKILFPKTNLDLTEWGSELHNCISSYEREVLNGQSCLFALTQNDSVKYCAEFNSPNFKLRQCLGKFNGKAPEEMVDELKKMVESAFNFDKLGELKKPELVFPESHKAKFIDITDFVDAEAFKNMRPAPGPQTPYAAIENEYYDL